MSSYLIKPICSCGGFCSQLNFILSWLYAIDGKNHKLDFSQNCIFKSCIWKRTVGELNIWEEIFEPINFKKNKTYENLPDELSSVKHTKINSSVLYISWHNPKINNYNLNNLLHNNSLPNLKIFSLINEPKFQLIRRDLNKVYKKYLIPKKIVLDKLNTYLKLFKNNYVIGVQIRSSQHYKLEDKYTTNQIVDNFIAETNKLDLPKNTKFFIATASSLIKDKIENYFGKEKVIYINTVRDNKNIKESKKKDFWRNDWSHNKRYQKKMKNYGLINYYIDVFLDVLLLSKCNLLIGGASNVFINALLLNKDVKYIIPNILKNCEMR